MKKTVLLIIDMQNGVCLKETYRLAEAIACIQTLRTHCLKNDIEVVYVRHNDDVLIHDTLAWEIMDELAPMKDAKIIDKEYNSAFLKTDLEAYLKQKEIDTLIITGMQSEYCIDATIKSAFERGYRVIVPKYATTTLDQKDITASTLVHFYEEVIWNHRYAEIMELTQIQDM